MVLKKLILIGMGESFCDYPILDPDDEVRLLEFDRCRRFITVDGIPGDYSCTAFGYIFGGAHDRRVLVKAESGERKRLLAVPEEKIAGL